MLGGGSREEEGEEARKKRYGGCQETEGYCRGAAQFIATIAVEEAARINCLLAATLGYMRVPLRYSAKQWDREKLTATIYITKLTLTSLTLTEGNT